MQKRGKVAVGGSVQPAVAQRLSQDRGRQNGFGGRIMNGGPRIANSGGCSDSCAWLQGITVYCEQQQQKAYSLTMTYFVNKADDNTSHSYYRCCNVEILLLLLLRYFK